METIRILSAEIHNLSRQELFERFTEGALFTPNVDFLMRMERDPAFREVFHRAEFRVCDSQILMMASHFLGTPFKEKISGSDFLGEFCRHHRDNPRYAMFFLGAEEGVAETAMAKMNEKLGRRFVVGAYAPPKGFERDPAECARVREHILESGAGSVAVALGAPKQEHWIMDNRGLLPGVHCYLGIGGSLAFEAGTIQRAPRLFSDYGLEWLWRLGKEPRRMWKRYLVDDLPFFGLLLKQKIRGSRPKLPYKG